MQSALLSYNFYISPLRVFDQLSLPHFPLAASDLAAVTSGLAKHWLPLNIHSPHPSDFLAGGKFVCIITSRVSLGAPRSVRTVVLSLLGRWHGCAVVLMQAAIASAICVVRLKRGLLGRIDALFTYYDDDSTTYCAQSQVNKCQSCTSAAS